MMGRLKKNLHTAIRIALCGWVVCFLSVAAFGADEKPQAKRVLIVGIDGCRADVFPACHAAEHFPKMIKEGAFSGDVDVLGDRETGALTVTGHGWSCILTGVWADKHKVKALEFKEANFREFPTFFKRLKQCRPETKTIALVSWLPFAEHIFSADEGCRLVADGEKVGFENADKAVAEQATKALAEEDPDAIFVYFGDVDINGHSYGFHPKAPRYSAAVERVDTHVGKLLEAIHNRPNYAAEDWLVIVCTDHGGQGKHHMDGKNVPSIRQGFVIMDGPSVQPGRIEGRHFNVDVAATALAHLGVKIDPLWRLDGEQIGLKP